MLKSHYNKPIALTAVVAILAGLGILFYLIWMREPETNIYRAEYLEKIIGEKSPIIFIVRDEKFHKTKCVDIENWVKSNTFPAPIYKKTARDGFIYRFLKYDEQISPSNAFLSHDFAAIMDDFLLCSMNDIDKKCYACYE